MNYQELVKDFTKRTMSNLDAIDKLLEAQQNKEEEITVYETTQLINSCLGLIVIPKETWLDNIPETSLVKLKADGWPIPELSDPSEPWQDLTLRQLIKYLRNAIVHWNIEILPDSENQICGLRIWNDHEENESKVHESTLSVQDLRKFVGKFSDMITSMD